MSILFVIIPLSLILVGLAIWAFIWAVDHDQFEDLDRAASSILFDDDLEQDSQIDPHERHDTDKSDVGSPPPSSAKEVR